MGQETTSIYRRRRPERTDLHLAVRENLELFVETYDERFLDRHGCCPGPTASRSACSPWPR